MTDTVLEVKNLSKWYGSRAAVDNVSFEIFRGEIFGLIGPNGAGKTTIIKMITGLAEPTSGEVYICGKSIQKNFEKAIKNVGGIIENPELYSYMSGYENLKFYASLYKGISKDDINKIVKFVGMEKRIKDKVKNYSLGMRQRVGIAQALLHNPQLLILDEPTNGLDPNGIKELRSFLIDLSRKKNISILVSSHILSEMELLCDTVGIIDGGKIIQVRTMEQIKKGLANEQKVAIKVDYPNYAGKIIMHRFKVEVQLAGNSIVFPLMEQDIPLATSELISNGVSIFSVNTIEKSLEEAFTDIIRANNNNNSIR